MSGYDEDVAILASKSLKPGTCRQFQSGWGKFGRHFTADKLRHEDVPTSSFGNFLGREFLDENLAASTVLNHFYACKKPAKFLFNLDLADDENIQDILSAVKKVRPGRRGNSAFPKWSLQDLLDFLNSEGFEPLEEASSKIICANSLS